MSDETTLLHCPFCGGEIPAPTRRYMSVLICPTCNAYGPGNSDMTNDELIAAWNTRAYLNQDGLPNGLTISDDGNLLNWRGENYVRQGTLGNDTLTAEQVCETVEKHGVNDGCVYSIFKGSFKAIADELNAELGSGTCEFVVKDNMNESEGMGDVWIECSACHCQFDYYADDWLMKMSYCPNCSARNRKAVER